MIHFIICNIILIWEIDIINYFIDGVQVGINYERYQDKLRIREIYSTLYTFAVIIDGIIDWHCNVNRYTYQYTIADNNLIIICVKQWVPRYVYTCKLYTRILHYSYKQLFNRFNLISTLCSMMQHKQYTYMTKIQVQRTLQIGMRMSHLCEKIKIKIFLSIFSEFRSYDNAWL